MPIQYKVNHDAIEQALVSWLKVHADLQEVQFLNLPIHRPPVPFGTLQIITPGLAAGMDQETWKYNSSTDLMDQMISGPRRMTVQVTVHTKPPYSSGLGQDLNHAQRRLEKAVSALRLYRVSQEFRDVGLAFLRVVSPPVRLDEQLGERWEWRARTDLEFGFTAAVADVSAPGDGTAWIDTIQPPAVTFLE